MRKVEGSDGEEREGEKRKKRKTSMAHDPVLPPAARVTVLCPTRREAQDFVATYSLAMRKVHGQNPGTRMTVS